MEFLNAYQPQSSILYRTRHLHNAGAFKECVFDSDQTVLDRVEGEKGISKGREGAIIIRMPSPSHQTSTKRCMQPSNHTMQFPPPTYISKPPLQIFTCAPATFGLFAGCVIVVQNVGHSK